MSGTLVVYPNGTDQPGVEFKCANGFVSRVVSAVAAQNIPDAERVCQILNATDAELTSAKARLTARITELEALVAELKATHPKFATSSADYWQRVGKGPADAVAIVHAIDEVIGDWMLDDDYHPGMIAIRNKMDEARVLLSTKLEAQG